MDNLKSKVIGGLVFVALLAGGYFGYQKFFKTIDNPELALLNFYKEYYHSNTKANTKGEISLNILGDKGDKAKFDLKIDETERSNLKDKKNRTLDFDAKFNTSLDFDADGQKIKFDNLGFGLKATVLPKKIYASFNFRDLVESLKKQNPEIGGMAQLVNLYNDKVFLLDFDKLIKTIEKEAPVNDKDLNELKELIQKDGGILNTDNAEKVIDLLVKKQNEGKGVFKLEKTSGLLSCSGQEFEVKFNSKNLLDFLKSDEFSNALIDSDSDKEQFKKGISDLEKEFNKPKSQKFIKVLSEKVKVGVCFNSDQIKTKFAINLNKDDLEKISGKKDNKIKDFSVKADFETEYNKVNKNEIKEPKADIDIVDFILSTMMMAQPQPINLEVNDEIKN